MYAIKTNGSIIDYEQLGIELCICTVNKHYMCLGIISLEVSSEGKYDFYRFCGVGCLLYIYGFPWCVW